MEEFRIHKIDWTGEKSARIWDYYSSNENYRNTFFGKQVGKLVVKFINKKINIRQQNDILDFSCGMGDIMAEFLPYLNKKQKLHATDFSKKNIEFVNKRFDGNINFDSAILLQSLPSKLPSNSYDLVLLTEVVEHLNDEELNSTLVEINRILRKGGYIFITTPNDEKYEANEIMCPDCGCIYHKWQHVRTWNIKNLEITVSKYGFSTFYINALNWMGTKAKILSLIKKRKNGGLVYIGRKN